MIRNYFSDLELPTDASAEEVKQAYRRLARRYHPDLNPENPQAERSFRIIREAFEFLESPTRVTRLRKQLEVEISQIRKIKRASSKTNSEMISVERRAQPRRKMVESLDIHLRLKVEQIKHRAPYSVEFYFERPCDLCRVRESVTAGRPKLPSKNRLIACTSCHGKGHHSIQRGANRWKKVCEKCAGQGFVASACEKCRGSAKVSEFQRVEFRVPDSVDLGRPICLRGLGHISYDGKKRGDVWVQLEKKK